MNDATALKSLMSEQAESRIAETLAAARAKADQLRASAEGRAAARERETLEALEAELQDTSARSRDRAQAEARLVVKTTKDQIVDEVLAEAKRILAAKVNTPEFSAVLRQLLAELLVEAPDDGVVLAPAQHADSVREGLAAAGRFNLQIEAAPGLRDGVAVQDKQRRFRVTNSLSSRFDQRERQLRRFAMGRLFGQHEV